MRDRNNKEKIMVIYQYLDAGQKITLLHDQKSDFGCQVFVAGSSATVIESLGYYLCNIKTENGTIITVPTNEVERAKTEGV